MWRGKKREYRLAHSPNKWKVKCKSEGEEEKECAVILFLQNKTNDKNKTYNHLEENSISKLLVF